MVTKHKGAKIQIPGPAEISRIGTSIVKLVEQRGPDVLKEQKTMSLLTKADIRGKTVLHVLAESKSDPVHFAIIGLKSKEMLDLTYLTPDNRRCSVEDILRRVGGEVLEMKLNDFLNEHRSRIRDSLRDD